MLVLSKSQMKAKVLEYFRLVQNQGEEIVITDHGKPALKVIPFSSPILPDKAFSEIRKKAVVHGDLLEPEAEEWRAARLHPPAST